MVLPGGEEIQFDLQILEKTVNWFQVLLQERAAFAGIRSIAGGDTGTKSRQETL